MGPEARASGPTPHIADKRLERKDQVIYTTSMVTRSDKLAMIGPSLADLVLEIFCFAASPSFRGVATLVSKARQAVKDAGSSSPELARDHSDLGKRITDALVTKVKAAREQCLDRGIDTSLLAQAESAVAALISTDAEHDLVVLSAVRNPAGFENYLRTRGAKHRQQIEEQAEPYFDALVQAVAATYVEIAPWSDSFVVIALKSLLGECTDIKEQLNASQIENRQLLSQILQILQSLTEAIEALSKPSHTERVFFGSRPEVVAGDRFIERDEQKHLITLIGDPTKRRSVLVGMSGCGKTQLASALAQQCEDSNWSLVAWVNAGSSKSIKRDLVELAMELEIPTSDQPSPDTLIERCRNHLQSAKSSDRLIIFDNVKDLDDLHGLVPTGDSIRIVATTTNNTGWDDQGWDTIKVGVFDREKSIDYLLTVTKSDDHDAADTLARRLGDLPLAITQAACVCKRLNISLSKFNDLLNNQPIEKVLYHTSNTEDHKDIVNTIIATYHLVFERIKDDKVAHIATCILQALCYLSESGVPTYWLTDEGVIESLDAYAILVESSLIQQSHDQAVTIIHPLYSYSFRKLFSRNDEDLIALQTAAYCLQYGAGLAWDETETNKQISKVKEFERQLLSCIIQNHSKGILCSKGVHEAMDALLHIQIQHREEFADLEDIARNAMKELLINWDWNDPAHHYKLE